MTLRNRTAQVCFNVLMQCSNVIDQNIIQSKLHKLSYVILFARFKYFQLFLRINSYTLFLKRAHVITCVTPLFLHSQQNKQNLVGSVDNSTACHANQQTR